MADIENATSKQNLTRDEGSVCDYSVLVMLNNYTKYIDLDRHIYHPLIKQLLGSNANSSELLLGKPAVQDQPLGHDGE